MPGKKIYLDPRFFQVSFQFVFLIYGLLFLDWKADWQHYSLTILGCLFFNYSFESLRQRKWLPLTGSAGFQSWGFSVLISALSLCLLLKVNFWWVSLLAAALTVASKYLFRFKGKHIFNPSAFGIIAAIVLTHDAWLSPGQWGSNAVLFFFIVTLGTIVVTRVQKLDVSLAFLLTYIGLLYWRQVYVLHWPMDHFIHSISSGSLLLFSFFMISDPRTAPNHSGARIFWAVLIAAVAFYLSAFKWIYSTPVWVLVAAAPLVPLFDRLFKAASYHWKPSGVGFSYLSRLSAFIGRPVTRKVAVSLLFTVFAAYEVFAFCGFYVSKADGTLKNKTSQVILVHDGDKNVVTMYNDFQGDFKDFAMVVPVPVVLKKKDIRVVDQSIFTTLNEYSKPRLVEYYDQNPCNSYQYNYNSAPTTSNSSVSLRGMRSMSKEETVKIEAQYIVGEYDILILSATESSGLKTWLTKNGYKIPENAEEVLEPYIKSNLKFFVVKVNEKEKKKLPGNFLRPIQISYSSPKFMLPIRLGMANADGDQDLLIYAFTKQGRIECTNYRTVAAPTGNKVPLFVKDNFSAFYSNVFQHQWKQRDESVTFLEYSWDVSPQNYVKCDPCVAVAPSTQDLTQAGVWWLTRNWNDYSDVENENNEEYSSNVHFTRLHVRYNRHAFPQDLMFQVTPNRESFQARYVLTHPASGEFNCDAGKKYLIDLKKRRKEEVKNLKELTGKGLNDWDDEVVSKDEANIPFAYSYKVAEKELDGEHPLKPTVYMAGIGALGLLGLAVFRRKKNHP